MPDNNQQFTPAWNGSNQVAVTYGQAITLQNIVIDRTTQLQARLGIYNFMPLTNKNTYNITTINVGGLLLKADACTLSDGGAITSTNRDLTPCVVAMAEDVCDTNLMSSAFMAAKNYLDNQGSETYGAWATVVERLATQTIAMHNKSLLALAIAGSSYGAGASSGSGNYIWNANLGANANRRTAYNSQRDRCEGLLYKIAQVTASNVALDESEGGFVVANYTGGNFDATKVLTLFDNLMLGAPDLLKTYMEAGIVNTNDGVERQAIWWVDGKTHNAVVRAYNAAAAEASQNRGGRIHRIELPNADPMKTSQAVYKIDNVWVIPVTEQNVFDSMLTGWLAFGYLTLTGVLSIGMSFSRMPFEAYDFATNTISSGSAAINIQDLGATDNKKVGTYSLVAKSLVVADVTDYDLVYGMQAFIKPA